MSLEEWATRLVSTRHTEGEWARARWSDLDDKARQRLPVSACEQTTSSVFRAFIDHLLKARLGATRTPGTTFALLSRDGQILLHIATPTADRRTIAIDEYAIVGNAVTFQRSMTKTTLELCSELSDPRRTGE